MIPFIHYLGFLCYVLMFLFFFLLFINFGLSALWEMVFRFLMVHWLVRFIGSNWAYRDLFFSLVGALVIDDDVLIVGVAPLEQSWL